MKFLGILIFIGSLITSPISGASETTKGMQKDYQSFKEEMSTKMDALEKQINELKEKAKAKGSSVKKETLEELEATRDELRTQIAKAENSSKKQWKSMKKNISESIDSLHSKLQSALKE